MASDEQDNLDSETPDSAPPDSAASDSNSDASDSASDTDSGSGTDSAEAPANDAGGGGAAAYEDYERYDALYDVNIELRAILGSAKMEVSNLLKLGRGAVIELDQKVKEDVTVLAAGKLIAYGQVVVVDENIAVKITRLARSDAN